MDVEIVEKLVRVLSGSTRLTEMEVRQGDITVRLRRPDPVPAPVRSPRASGKSVPVPGTVGTILPSTTVTVMSEFVGVFHAPTTGTPEVGSSITQQQVLGQIETMRLMNSVAAPTAGRLQAILVQNGQPVEYGQPLFEIVPEETL